MLKRNQLLITTHNENPTMAKSRNNRKKRKNNKQLTQNQQKELRLHRINRFYTILCEIAEAWDAEAALALLPTKHLIHLFKRSINPIILDVSNTKVPSHIRSTIKYILNKYSVEHIYTIAPEGKTVSLKEYSTYVTGLAINISLLEDDLFEGVSEFKHAFKGFCAYITASFDDMSRRFMLHSYTFSILFSEINAYYYIFKYNIVVDETLKPIRGKHIIVTEKIRHETKSILIDNLVRPVFRVGGQNLSGDFEWARMKVVDLGINSSFGNMKLPVYIQSHVIHRLYERLDCKIPASLHYFLYRSVAAPKIIQYNGNAFIEYYLDNDKLGYLKAEIVDGLILIRTFLFITNSDTPEGDRLKEMFGISKVDKKYLNIDKLSTFIHSDVKENVDLVALFKKVNCAHLFNVKKTSLNDYAENKAELMTKYLQIEEKHSSEIKENIEVEEVS